MRSIRRRASEGLIGLLVVWSAAGALAQEPDLTVSLSIDGWETVVDPVGDGLVSREAGVLRLSQV